MRIYDSISYSIDNPINIFMKPMKTICNKNIVWNEYQIESPEKPINCEILRFAQNDRDLKVSL